MIDIHRYAGHPEQYSPNADKIIVTVLKSVQPSELDIQDTLRTIRDVFEGLYKADIAGFISTANEHEWAYLYVRANELATQPSDIDKKLASEAE